MDGCGGLCGLTELQTSHTHPMVGMPTEVPLPSTVSIAFTVEGIASAGLKRIASTVGGERVGAGSSRCRLNRAS